MNMDSLAMHLSMQGTERTKEHLDIFLEFVPGGSISSLLDKFGAWSAELMSSMLSKLNMATS